MLVYLQLFYGEGGGGGSLTFLNQPCIVEKMILTISLIYIIEFIVSNES